MPRNRNDWLQPLDAVVNKPLKVHMRQYFQQWCTKEANKMYQRNGTSDDIIKTH